MSARQAPHAAASSSGGITRLSDDRIDKSADPLDLDHHFAARLQQVRSGSSEKIATPPGVPS
jgi:hypothetical protein